ncbi:hypothetical protein PVK06_027763 [Gossypium arboreum]|uniref:Reverse transcriptase domain-containing protein n=1 Tax=Gossypium arboreum TaxID=29729 RepID=A0ABR0P3W8_GOSAR|nr:hypothetical protein PVK06_027763 [Gossypium arboreum]
MSYLTSHIVRQSKSDREAILMDTNGSKPKEKGNDHRAWFRYDIWWAKEKEARDIITSVWSNEECNILEKMELVLDKMGPWKHQHYRRMKNNIKGLKKEITKLLDVPTNERSMSLLKNARDERDLNDVPECINEDMNKRLNGEFADEEILTTFKQMEPHKAPKIDGLSEIFFKDYWPTMGVDVLSLCHDILKGNKSAECINETLIVLIPKIKNPCEMANFHPITLCKVIYKIVLKTLATWLKDVLPMCISQNQSAFVPNRMIHDNVLVAHTLMHYLRSSKNGPNKGCVVKLDMRKVKTGWNGVLLRKW